MGKHQTYRKRGTGAQQPYTRLPIPKPTLSTPGDLLTQDTHTNHNVGGQIYCQYSAVGPTGPWTPVGQIAWAQTHSWGDIHFLPTGWYYCGTISNGVDYDPGYSDSDVLYLNPM